MRKKRIKKHLLVGAVSALGLGFFATVAQACAPQPTRGFLTLGDVSWDGLNYLIDNLASPLNAASLVETPLISPRNRLDIMNSPVGSIDLEGGFNELLDIQPLSYVYNGNVTDQEGNDLVFEGSSSPFAQPGQDGLVRRERRDPAVAEYYRPLWINDVAQSNGQETTSYRGFTFLMGDNTDPTNGVVNSPRWRDQNDNFINTIEENGITTRETADVLPSDYYNTLRIILARNSGTIAPWTQLAPLGALTGPNACFSSFDDSQSESERNVAWGRLNSCTTGFGVIFNDGDSAQSIESLGQINWTSQYSSEIRNYFNSSEIAGLNTGLVPAKSITYLFDFLPPNETFLSLLTHGSSFPTNMEFYNSRQTESGSDYFAAPFSTITSGPFRYSDVIYGFSGTFAKSEEYYKANSTLNDGVIIQTAASGGYYQNFRAGAIDWAIGSLANSVTVTDANRPELREAALAPYRITNTGSPALFYFSYFLAPNANTGAMARNAQTSPIFDVNFRRAFSWILNAQRVDQLAQTATIIPAKSAFIPYNLGGDSRVSIPIGTTGNQGNVSISLTDYTSGRVTDSNGVEYYINDDGRAISVESEEFDYQTSGSVVQYTGSGNSVLTGDLSSSAGSTVYDNILNSGGFSSNTYDLNTWLTIPESARTDQRFSLQIAEYFLNQFLQNTPDGSASLSRTINFARSAGSGTGGVPPYVLWLQEGLQTLNSMSSRLNLGFQDNIIPTSQFFSPSGIFGTTHNFDLSIRGWGADTNTPFDFFSGIFGQTDPTFALASGGNWSFATSEYYDFWSNSSSEQGSVDLRNQNNLNLNGMGPFSSSGSATTVTAGEVFSNLPNLTVANASNNFYDSDASQWGYINTLLKAFYNDVPAMGYTISQAQTTVNRIAGLAESSTGFFSYYNGYLDGTVVTINGRTYQLPTVSQFVSASNGGNIF